MKNTLIFLLFFLPKIVLGFSISSNLDILKHEKKALTLLEDNKSDSSIIYYKELAEYLVKKNKWIKYADVNNSLSKIYQRLIEYEKAEEFLLKNLSINNNQLDSLHPNIGTTYNILGSISYNKGLYDKAIEYSEKAIQIYKQHNNAIYKNKIAVQYTNLGVFYSRKKNYKKSLMYYNYSLDILLNAKNAKKKYLLSTYINIGKLHKDKEDYDKAIVAYNKALELYTEKKNSEYYTAKSNIAVAYQKKGEYQKSLDILYNILEEYKSNKREDRIHKHIGTAYYHIKNYDKALLYLNQSLIKKKKHYKRKHPFLAKNNTAIGNVYFELQDFKIALKYYQNSIINLCLNFNDSTNNYNPKLELISDKGELLTALRKKATTLAKMDNPETALETYLLSIELNESIGYQHSDLESRNFQYQETRAIYEKAMALAHQLYENTGEQLYLEKAFKIAEHSKSSLLVQSLQDTEAHHIGGVPAELIEKEKELTVEISFYENKLFKIKKEADKSKMEQTLFHKREELDKLIRQLEKDYPKYYEEKYSRNEISIADVKAGNTENDVFLEYFSGTDAYYIIAIDHKEARIVKKDYSDGFEKDLKDFLSSMNSAQAFQDGEKNYSTYIQSGHALYQHLLEPVKELTKEKQLTISPDGKLSYIPFEALLSEKLSSMSADYRKVPYLLKKHSIHYAFSAGLHYKANGQQEEYPEAFAGYAPTYGEGKLQQLNWSRKEVSNAANLFEGNAFTGTQANKKHFMKHKDKYQILHLAMHASADSLNPMHSRLIFGEKKDTESLYAYELCNMNIASELVVLSACETGAGQLINGEGVMSLARSFFYAGCPSVIMSQWQLDDRTSTEIMQSFYKYLNEGENKSEALRLAKIDFINKSGPIKSNPLYWASIVAVGDPRPIHDNKNSYWYFTLLILPLGFFFYRNRREAKAA